MTRILIFLFVLLCESITAQQTSDTTVAIPIYPNMVKKGIEVYMDASHHNFHTANGSFSGFANLLRAHGYQVKSLDSPHYDPVKILVIANALHPDNNGNWDLPNPSAFSREEIKEIQKWVEGGGRLLLIADHMPFAGAAAQLGETFGIRFLNGFACNSSGEPGNLMFTKAESELWEKLQFTDSVMTFAGSAFIIPEKSQCIFRFHSGDMSLQPAQAWQFSGNTPRESLSDYCQGALFPYGKGKIAVFGEAAMFTAQVSQGHKVGFNHPKAPNNARFILEVMEWLTKN